MAERGLTAGLALLLAAIPRAGSAQTPDGWPMHSMDRPQPRAVTPGPAVKPAPPPSDAIVLFAGKDLSRWESETGAPAPWSIRDGYVEVVPGSGSIRTRQGFGDAQLHIEWAAPPASADSGQERGNSGVFFMERYEVQVLDSYRSRTYPDGQAGAVYGQFPPLVNASRPPGTWQSYDIVFHAPRFDAAGRLAAPARLTVFHNGVLVQDDVSLVGPTSHQRREPYESHAGRLPLALQDHGRRVRYRNIWIRELGGERR